MPNNARRGPSGLNIKVVDVQRLISLRQEQPPLLDHADLVTVGAPTREHVQVLVSPEAFERIRTHVGSDVSREMGGFLVGRPYEWDGQIYVEIDGALPGRLTASNAVQLKITHDTWAEAQNEVRKLFPSMHLVGWYHSHPNIGVFMSGSDVMIHQDIFSEPWHVALVLDPTRQEAQFFGWEQQLLRGVGGYQVAYPEASRAEERWRMPEPMTERQSKGVSSLAQFYKVGSWYTRWSEPDELVVRARRAIINDIQNAAAQGSNWVVGILFGRVSTAIEARPSYYIDILDALVASVDGIVGVEKLPSAVTRTLNRLLDLMRRSQTATIVGLFFWSNQTHIEPEPLFRGVFQTLFTNPWNILITGDAMRGPEYCLWADQANAMVQRRLIEWIPLLDITESDRELIDAQARQCACASASRACSTD